MKHFLWSTRRIAGFLVLLGLVSFTLMPARAQEQIASVESLKSEAFKALRGGEFDKSYTLLREAATISTDPMVARMAKWADEFESQRQVFATERKQQYDDTVKDVHKLLGMKMDDYAIDMATKAYSLATDKEAFRNEPWVTEITRDAKTRASKYELDGQWLKALRVYSDLGSIEPSNALWKEKLKQATRRIRLLAWYAPDEFKAIQEIDRKERAEAEALISPTTQPTVALTPPATQPIKPASDIPIVAGEDEDAFKMDAREMLRDIDMSMVQDALIDARTNYYRDTSYRELLLGGLGGLKILVQTPGLEGAFPGLGDPKKRADFLAEIDASIARANEANENNENLLLPSTIAKLKSVNRFTVALPDEVLASEFADGTFAQLDPFSSMIWPNDVEEFTKQTQGEFSGIGIQISMDEAGNLEVVSPLEDTPAYKAKVKAGDVITHIDGKSAKGISLNQAVKSITGPSGTSVTLTVKSTDNKVRDLTIRRENIKVASIKGWFHKPGGGWDYFIDDQEKIAYMRLTNFTKSTSDEFDKAYKALVGTGARAIILDLRNNPGGLLLSATEVSDKFLKDGVIVSTRADRETPNQPTSAGASPDLSEVEIPTVVLVNQYSASASEIVSGALKDHKRALVVGERTFGKGSVQMLFPLSARTAYLKLTTSHYYLPSGRCIHREENSQEWGVDPDVTIEMTPKQMEALITARQELEVLHDEDFSPLLNTPVQTPASVEGTATVATALTPNQKLLKADPQLSAALLLMRLQLAGAEL